MNNIKNKTAFLFPGQGSQVLGMGRELANIFPLAKATFEEADDVLGFPLSSLAWEGPEEELNDTINTQPALLVHSVATLRVLKSYHPEFRPNYVAGHSMGELSTLVASEALPFSDTLNLARTRGELMKGAGQVSPGGMAAIIGLDVPTIEEICLNASTGEDVVVLANDNCPGQVVISGAIPALERAMDSARAAKARRVVRLKVSIAAHSPLMIHAQNAFNQAVTTSPISDPKIPIIGNVSATPMITGEDIRSDLKAQLRSRVRWTESIQYMINAGVTRYIEIGSGSVLIGLLKRIDRDITGLTLGIPSDFDELKIE
jgi:[acyl-carrier-protein] S-malonyltransferase